MTLLLLEAFDPDETSLDLTDGYYLIGQIDWGNVVWEHLFSGRRGTQGARAVGGAPQSRPVSIPVRIVGGTTDELAEREAALGRIADLMRRFGGRITWQPPQQTYRQYLEVLVGGLGLAPWDRRADNRHVHGGIIALVCAPYALGDPFDVHERWREDTFASGRWQMEAGAKPTIAAGWLVPADTNTFQARFVGTGYRFGDVQITHHIRTGATTTGLSFEIYARAQDTLQTWIYALLDVNSIDVGKRVNVTPTSLASTAFTPQPDTDYWLRLRIENSKVTCEIFTSPPTPMSTPAAATTPYTLNTEEQGMYAAGWCGFRTFVADDQERYGGVDIEPFTYRALTTPEVIDMQGPVPGDTTALADLHITPSGAGGGSGATGTGGNDYPVYALAGWARRPALHNLVTNGDFEDSDRGTAGWSSTGVTGVTGAANSVSRSTSLARAKYGTGSLQIVCPATANTGATWRAGRRFRRGQRYLAALWLNSAAQTTNARIRLGVNGDIASSAAQQLNSGGKLHSVLWAPTADRSAAYIAAEITAATGTTMNADAVVLCDAYLSTLGTGLTASDSTIQLAGAVPFEWPDNGDFYVLIEPGAAANEIVYVPLGGVDRANNRLTNVVRGAERSTAATHAAGVEIVLLPILRSHLEGAGAPPPFGIIEGETADWRLIGWSVTTDTDYRGDSGLQGTASGIGVAEAQWLVDPNLMVPDDYTAGHLDVDVYGRLELDGDLKAVRAQLSVLPDVGFSYAYERPAPAGADVQKRIHVPGNSNAGFRFCLLGRARLHVDRAQPIRHLLYLVLSWSAGSSGVVGLDYLVLVPSLARASSPEGDMLDGYYPRFVQSTAETTRVWRSDGTGWAAKPPGPLFLDAGPGGAYIEPDAGQTSLVVKLSSMVPDNPGDGVAIVASEFEEHTATVHWAVTPRFALLRSG